MTGRPCAHADKTLEGTESSESKVGLPEIWMHSPTNRFIRKVWKPHWFETFEHNFWPSLLTAKLCRHRGEPQEPKLKNKNNKNRNWAEIPMAAMKQQPNSTKTIFNRSSTICYLKCPVFNKKLRYSKTLKYYPYSGKKWVSKNCQSGPRFNRHKTLKQDLEICSKELTFKELKGKHKDNDSISKELEKQTIKKETLQ